LTRFSRYHYSIVCLPAGNIGDNLSLELRTSSRRTDLKEVGGTDDKINTVIAENMRLFAGEQETSQGSAQSKREVTNED